MDGQWPPLRKHKGVKIMVNKGNLSKGSKKLKKAAATMAVSQDDARRDDTNMALPDDENVKRARDWVNMNKK